MQRFALVALRIYRLLPSVPLLKLRFSAERFDMQVDWESEVRAVSAVALATSVAALAMQVFTLSETRPKDDRSLRALLNRVAPDGVSDHVLAAAEGLLSNALLEAEALKSKFATKQ